MKMSPVGAELFHADGRTDMKKLIVAFRNFANAPENYLNFPPHPSDLTEPFFKHAWSSLQLSSISEYQLWISSP